MFLTLSNSLRRYYPDQVKGYDLSLYFILTEKAPLFDSAKIIKNWSGAPHQGAISVKVRRNPLCLWDNQ